MQTPFIIGERIYLRPLEREDAMTVQGWVNHPDVRRLVRTNRPLNLRAEEQMIDKFTQSETDLGLVIMRRDIDKAVGICGLNRIDFRNSNAEFGIIIAPDEWNQGFGTEATALLVQHGFETLNLHRVYLYVYEYNPRAIRAYEKVGFQKEGVLRQDSFREGRYWDTIVMGILREEWQAARQRTAS